MSSTRPPQTVSRSVTDQQFVRKLPEDWFRTDTILAVVVGFIAVLSLQAWRLIGIFEETSADIVLAHVLSLLISSLLVLYRRFPVTIAAIYTVVILIGSITASTEIYSLLFVGFMTIYAVGAWVSNRRLAFWARLIIVAVHWIGTTVVVLLSGDQEQFDTSELEEIDPSELLYFIGSAVVISTGFYVAAWYFGTRAWNRAKERWKLQQAHDELADANQKIAQAAVQDERLHIARELHDVVAHHVTVMGVHASAARRLLEAGRDSTSVVEQLEHIEASSAQAVQELQTMVYTLRDQDGSTEPLPDLSQLPELIQQADSAPQSVSLEITGKPVPVSAAIELTLYRVAQEALSNVRKHAGDDVDVTVQLDYGESKLTLSVTDNGKAYEPLSNGTGTGVQGMQERVHAVDGTLEYGPRTPYGWKVIVRVPRSVVE